MSAADQNHFCSDILSKHILIISSTGMIVEHISAAADKFIIDQWGKVPLFTPPNSAH